MVYGYLCLSELDSGITNDVIIFVTPQNNHWRPITYLFSWRISI